MGKPVARRAAPRKSPPVQPIAFKVRKNQSETSLNHLKRLSRETSAHKILQIKTEDETQNSGPPQSSMSGRIGNLIQSGYSIHVSEVPCYPLLEKNLPDIHCPGCNRKFRGRGSILYKEPAFFDHCIRLCSLYQESNLIRECSGCKLLLLNREYLNLHNQEHHPNPQAQQLRRRRSSSSGSIDELPIFK